MSAEPNPLAQVGLPPSWQPAPLTWALARLDVNGPQGAQTFHVLRVETPYGVQGFAFDDDAARRLIDVLSAQVSGITVARQLPPNGKGPTP